MYWFTIHGLHSFLLYTTQDHLPKESSAHSRLGLPTSIINQEKVPIHLSIGQSDGGNFSIDVLSSLCQVEKKPSSTIEFYSNKLSFA